jgi:WD40 repeat protein
LRDLRDRWPPAHGPLVKILEDNGQSIPLVCILPDGSIVARIGAPYEPGRTIRIAGDIVIDVPEVGFFGRCPNRRYFAIAEEKGVRIVDGWKGPIVARCPWPTGLEGVPEGFDVPALKLPPTVTSLIPFPDGLRTLLVSIDGIFVLSPLGARRLLPTTVQMKEHFEWSRNTYPEHKLNIGLSMEHGAISKDGKLIVVGSQDSTHLVFDDQFNIVGNIGHRSEYPHYALFSADDCTIALNSCHFYNGITIGVSTACLPGITTAPYEDDQTTPILQDGSRVYAGASRGDEFIIGDASGYVRAFSTTGEARWQQFIGSSVGGMDLSADGKTIAVSTYAGFLAIFKLDAGIQARHQIGSGNHLETRRWILWKNESKPLIW